MPRAKSIPEFRTRRKSRPQEAIDARAWRQRVTEHRKAHPFLAQCADPLQDDARRELDPASRSDLDPLRSHRRIVTNSYEHPNVDQSTRSSRVQGQLENAAAARSPQFRLYNDQAPTRIENEIHNTIAVS